MMIARATLGISLLVFIACSIPFIAAGAGSQNYTTTGNYTFTVPSSFGTLTVTVYGGGGGGGGGAGTGYGAANGNDGNNANDSWFGSVVAHGGTAGTGGVAGGWNGYNGSPGSGTGGDSVTTGGGGLGGWGGIGEGRGGNGGNGGRVVKTYTPSTLTPGSTVNVVVGLGVGLGGSGGAGSPGGSNGDNGDVGSVYISWTDAAPTCSVTVDQNPINYGSSTTLRWSSANATTFYINNVGYVTPNVSGSATVGPLSTTAYNGTANGPGGSASCPRTLTVNAPSNCTFNGSAVNHGSSVTAYQAATVPYGQSCISQTRTCNNGTLSGSYQYQSCAVGPQCSLTVNPTSIAQGQSSTLTWSSNNATSCTGNNFSASGATSGSVSVSPSSSTTYSASCTGAGGSAQCTGSGQGGIGALLTVTCTPQTSYSCSGNTIIETSTSTTCAVTVTNPYAACSTPQFCSPGSSSCLIPSVSGSISASPELVTSGNSTTIFWTTSDAVACTVSGNGDTWTGVSSAAASCTHSGSACVSHPIMEITAYTLLCDDADSDTAQDDFSSSVTIYPVPSWLEL